MPLVLILLLCLVSCAPAPSVDPGIVTIALDIPPTNLDPRIGIDATSGRLAPLLFSSLVKTNAQYDIEPDLATSWEMPDPTTYVFHLRNDVRFHDGRPLTARDIVFTFTSILDGSIRTSKAGAYQLVESVEAPDDRTVLFKLKEPFAPFLWNLTRGAVGIVPEGAPEDFGRNPIGSGPFKFVHYVQDSEVVIARNDDYYDKKPAISVVRFKIIPDAIVRALEMRKGSIDIALNVLLPDMIEALRDDEHLEVMQSPGTNYQYLSFNLKDPVFGDLRVRQAIAHAIDRRPIIDYLLRGQARPASGVVPPNNWAYATDVAEYPYDPERARALLREAGHENLSFTYRTSQDPTGRLMASVFQQQLREVGIHMDIRSNEFATFFADVQNGNFQVYSLRWVGGNNDPDIFNLIFHSQRTPPNGANRGFYANAEVDGLIEMARRDVDTMRRRAMYQRIQHIVAEELPYLSLWYMDNVCVYNKRISGMSIYPGGEWDYLANITAEGLTE